MKIKRYHLCVLVVVWVVFCNSLCIVYASSANWVEVARIDGSAFPEPDEFFSQVFVADHQDWKISWGYNPVGSAPLESVLMIEKGSDLLVYSNGYSYDRGVVYIQGQQENFELYIRCINIYGYTIIVEKDVNSIPEFQPWIIVPMLVAATILVAWNRTKICKKQ